MQTLAAEVVALEERLLRLRSADLKNRHEASGASEVSRAMQAQLEAMAKERGGLLDMVQALREENAGLKAAAKAAQAEASAAAAAREQQGSRRGSLDAGSGGPTVVPPLPLLVGGLRSALASARGSARGSANDLQALAAAAVGGGGSVGSAAAVTMAAAATVAQREGILSASSSHSNLSSLVLNPEASPLQKPPLPSRSEAPSPSPPPAPQAASASGGGDGWSSARAARSPPSSSLPLSARSSPGLSRLSLPSQHQQPGGAAGGGGGGGHVLSGSAGGLPQELRALLPAALYGEPSPQVAGEVMAAGGEVVQVSSVRCLAVRCTATPPPRKDMHSSTQRPPCIDGTHHLCQLSFSVPDPASHLLAHTHMSPLPFQAVESIYDLLDALAAEKQQLVAKLNAQQVFVCACMRACIFVSD